MKKFLALFSVPAALLALGCGPGSDVTDPSDCGSLPEGKIYQACIDKLAPKADRMDAENDPRLFGVELETKWNALGQSGRALRTPWPETYWPTYEDAVNARWQGQGVKSPLEKYDLAFNNWVPPAGFDNLVPFKGCGQEFDADYYTQLGPAAKYWSNNKGNKAQRDAWQAADCEQKIEGWWGLCHAWVPASILEDEPVKAVTYNGVTFDVSDMKALMVMMYDQSSTRFVGERCNEKDGEIKRDENGRIIRDDCRDTNPGTLHLLVTNLLGRDKRAFAEDRTMDYQVWNQPVLGYRITQQAEIAERAAAKLLNADCETDGSNCEYTWDADAKKFVEVAMEVDYITESSPSTEPMIPSIGYYTRTDRYHYVLETLDDGTIIGGEWISVSATAFPERVAGLPNSQSTHADFLWLPLAAGRASNPYANLEKIRMLVAMSKDDQPGETREGKSFVNATPVSIPDNSATGARSLIQVDEDVTIAGLKVTVTVTHTYMGDVTLQLLHDGHTVELQKNAGGSTANLYKTFDVDDFNNASARGEWTLLAVDNASRDVGTIDKFELFVVGGSASAPSAEVFSASPAKKIPDNTATGITSSIQVTGTGAVKELKVTLDISHTYISDLVVELKHGTGTSTLHNREGDDADNLVKTYTVTDFQNVDSAGEWKLVVKDRAKQDTGKLNAWQLEIKR
jgi:subtilisin-like proprotein convertase family protein